MARHRYWLLQSCLPPFARRPWLKLFHSRTGGGLMALMGLVLVVIGVARFASGRGVSVLLNTAVFGVLSLHPVIR